MILKIKHTGLILLTLTILLFYNAYGQLKEPGLDDEDYGDAPENINGGYPTTIINNGARHTIDAAIFLGAMVDQEPDGQPSAGANCDDTDCLFPSFGDDEDGVAMPGAVIPGTMVNIIVTASVDGYLDAWMDFNLANGWTDAGEHIFNNVSVVAGPNNLSFNVPLNATSGQSYIRFRFRDFSGPVSFDGLISNGEVEDYAVTILESPGGNIDYGDAPDHISPGYATTLANNGARHTIDPAIFLGNSIDPEPDGQPDVYASCDDLDCLFPSLGDDEDGVVLPAAVSKGTNVNITVTASVDGFLDAWADFDINGSWADPGEHIFNAVPLVAGVNVLVISVPAAAASGQAYIRFRFRDFTAPLSYDGPAQNGEVEDYTFQILEETPQELDFGDAPENAAGGYPTTVAFNGARHIVDHTIYLGSTVDDEPDGQPNLTADCDDTDCLYPSLGDDEDGVTIQSTVSPGELVFFAVTASVDGYLDVWMDFNLDKDWNDPDEHFMAGLPISAGPNTLLFSVPGSAIPGQSYMRFRFRDYSGAISYDGLAQNGEVEDYAIMIIEAPSENIDFGDAPENTTGNYPTTLAHNGARHAIVPGIYLGNVIDSEPDAQPDINASCDDLDCLYPSLGDDEDGVTMPAVLNPGTSVPVTVSASVDGYLDAWFDFNGDQDWDDADEHVFTGFFLVAGPNVLNMTIPASADTGKTYARFRFRDFSGPIGYTGLLSNGEVEDYAVHISEPASGYDFGDAPENAAGDYPTTLANNGARHVITPGIFLGSFIDDEIDGQPGSDADCDDNDCLFPSLGDDEDGVTWAGPVSPGSSVTLNIVASVDGYLDAWMDFNLDQDWDDAGEHVFASTFIVAGPNVMNLSIPATADTGQSFARFRFRDFSGAINYDGLVPNGEVEDYAVNITLSKIKLDVKVILGAAVLPGWNPGDPAIMDTTLNLKGYLPLSQPYNDPSAIWYYNGNEQVPAMNKADIVDWIHTEVRETTGGPSSATSATAVAEQALFLLNDGSIVALDGSSLPEINHSPAGDLYLVIWHRNHLGIMSANPLINLGGGVYSWDFTSGPNQAYGTNAQMQVAAGYYGMIPGDAEPDGQVDALDYAVWRVQATNSGFKKADFDLNGEVDNKDKNDDWWPNVGNGVQIP